MVQNSFSQCYLTLQEVTLGVQVWLGEQIEADPQDPAWQDLVGRHSSGSATTSDRDELGGSRMLRPRQRVTLTSVLDLPSGDWSHSHCDHASWFCKATASLCQAQQGQNGLL